MAASPYTTTYGGFVQMLPNETFFQITNFRGGISGNFVADIVNICGNLIKNIDGSFFYKFFNNNGTQQMAYEFAIAEDFDRIPLILRLTDKLTGTQFFSPPFLCTYYNYTETVRFDYSSERMSAGIDYSAAPFFQSIRLQCFLNDVDQEVDSEDILQLSGYKYFSRVVKTILEKYTMYLSDARTFRALSDLLDHPIIYIDGIRCNTSSSLLSKAERIADSNVFSVDFSVNPTRERRYPTYQLWTIDDTYILTNDERTIVYGDFNNID